MLNSDPTLADEAAEDAAAARIVKEGGARGALALAGVATAIVVAIWFIFYVFVFIPRATVP